MRPQKKYGTCFPESLRRFSLVYFWLEKGGVPSGLDAEQ
jgi:hypothetical protein